MSKFFYCLCSFNLCVFPPFNMCRQTVVLSVSSVEYIIFFYWPIKTVSMQRIPYMISCIDLKKKKKRLKLGTL